MLLAHSGQVFTEIHLILNSMNRFLFGSTLNMTLNDYGVFKIDGQCVGQFDKQLFWVALQVS